ncbi:type II toxin-antitoxin system HicB family antitoxin, partial [bacterium]|nr:type II toxin-antitoxin system HicB family antitoxin [bacterium]
MIKNLKYYLSLKYPVEIVEIQEEDGGGYSACIPQLGRNTFVGDGSNMEEAIENLEEIKTALFDDYLAKTIPILEPELPERNEDKQFSGRFIMRIPKELHSILYN